MRACLFLRTGAQRQYLNSSGSQDGARQAGAQNLQCQACMATTRQQIAQKTQYSMPPMTQIQLLVSL